MKYLHSTVKGIIEISSIIGGTLSELFGYIIPAPIEKRRAEWMITIKESIYKLQEKESFDIKSLSDNEMFITAVLKASEMAQRTHQKEDLDVLRNAVINSDKKIDIKDSICARNIRNYCRNSTAK